MECVEALTKVATHYLQLAFHGYGTSYTIKSKSGESHGMGRVKPVGDRWGENGEGFIAAERFGMR